MVGELTSHVDRAQLLKHTGCPVKHQQFGLSWFERGHDEALVEGKAGIRIKKAPEEHI